MSEQNGLLLVCMTHGRADTISTQKVIPDIAMCVSETQAKLYRKELPDQEYLVHPDSVIGISPKRKWLMENVDCDVIMFDDDMVSFLDVTVPLGEQAKIKDPERIRSICERSRDTVEAMGGFLFGYSSYADPAMMRPTNPFEMTGMVSGNALGLRQGSKIWFPDTPDLLTDDLWISAMNAYEHRFTFRDMRYAVANKKTWVGRGGMASIRTWDRVIGNEKRLVEAFGDAIYRRGNTGRSSVKVEIQLSLRCPWK